MALLGDPKRLPLLHAVMHQDEASRRRLGYAALAAAAAAIFGARGLQWLWDTMFPADAPLKRQPQLQRKLRVAIVGAGVGGSALAHWLRDLYGDDLELTLICDSPIGGRCQGVEVDGQRYEGGAAIISDLNKYMLSFMKRLGLKEKYFKGFNVPVGVFDGESLRVCEVSPERAPFGVRKLASTQSAWRFIRRYGIVNLRRLKALMRHPVAPKFPVLYDRLKRGDAFTTPEALLQALGTSCTELTRKVASTWLSESYPRGGGLSDQIIAELVTGGMHSNYGGQGCGLLHAFVGLVSIAGGFASRCFAVLGGNQQVPEGLVRLAKPDELLQRTLVRSVRRWHGQDASQGWELAIEPNIIGEAMKGDGSLVAAEFRASEVKGPFDIVAIAHPLERSCVSFEGLETDAKAALEAWKTHGHKYRRCVTHFVRGSLRGSYFRRDTEATGSSAESLPMMILTCEDARAPFYSIGLQLPVNVETAREADRFLAAALQGEIGTYKIFAPSVLTGTQLDDIFERRSGQPAILDWYAYPEYRVPQSMFPFCIDCQQDASLIYLNAIEQAASAMEMSAVSARNAANLVVDFVQRRRGAQGGF